MDLAHMYADYVRTEKEDRDPHRLFVSDVGKCPRQVWYRMQGTGVDFVSEQEAVNKQLMFDLAEHIEETLWLALKKQGLGLGYQGSVPIEDRENWGGRYDILADYGGLRVIEVKTLYPGAFRYDFDYPTHRYQASIYDHYLKDELAFEAVPLLWYADRGGQNTAVEKEVIYEWEPIAALMDDLEALRKMDEVPDRLPRVLVERSYKKQIVEECSGLCNYCPYKGNCFPDESKSVWAKRTNTSEPYEATRAADPFKLAEFADHLISNATGD